MRINAFFLALSSSVSLSLDVNLASKISLSSEILYVLIFLACSGDVATTHANSFLSSFGCWLSHSHTFGQNLHLLSLHKYYTILSQLVCHWKF